MFAASGSSSYPKIVKRKEKQRFGVIVHEFSYGGIAISRVHATLLVTVSVSPSVGMTSLPSNCLRTQKWQSVTDRPTDGPTDTVTYRVACTRLKNSCSRIEYASPNTVPTKTPSTTFKRITRMKLHED